MKKITHFLRFLALVFFMFLAIVVCFVFNKVLDQKISEGQAEVMEAVNDYKEDTLEGEEE
ncbi:MAG: hypothetical protein J6A77_01910 [Lachnospiraceae bacterium]|nr:hypothetical protein [Lachnospiraceae bacterium]